MLPLPPSLYLSCFLFQPHSLYYARPKCTSSRPRWLQFLFGLLTQLRWTPVHTNFDFWLKNSHLFVDESRGGPQVCYCCYLSHMIYDIWYMIYDISYIICHMSRAADPRFATAATATTVVTNTITTTTNNTNTTTNTSSLMKILLPPPLRILLPPPLPLLLLLLLILLLILPLLLLLDYYCY